MKINIVDHKEVKRILKAVAEYHASIRKPEPLLRKVCICKCGRVHDKRPRECPCSLRTYPAYQRGVIVKDKILRHIRSMIRILSKGDKQEKQIALDTLEDMFSIK